MKLCLMCVGLVAFVLGGCQQRTSFPSQITASVKNVEQAIVQGDLELVKYAEGAEVVTLDFSEDDSRPEGTLYRDFLVIVHEQEQELPAEQAKRGIRKYEETTQVIPTRLITSIKFFKRIISHTVTIQP